MIRHSLCCVAVAATSPSHELQPLFKAIRVAETGGSLDSTSAGGDHGRSIGPYQISRKYRMDSGMDGTRESCRDAAVAERAMFSYWRRHCPEALRRQDFAVLARVHNGGPRVATREPRLAFGTSSDTLFATIPRKPVDRSSGETTDRPRLEESWFEARLAATRKANRQLIKSHQRVMKPAPRSRNVALHRCSRTADGASWGAICQAQRNRF